MCSLNAWITNVTHRLGSGHFVHSIPFPKKMKLEGPWYDTEKSNNSLSLFTRIYHTITLDWKCLIRHTRPQNEQDNVCFAWFYLEYSVINRQYSIKISDNTVKADVYTAKHKSITTKSEYCRSWSSTICVSYTCTCITKIYLQISFFWYPKYHISFLFQIKVHSMCWTFAIR